MSRQKCRCGEWFDLPEWPNYDNVTCQSCGVEHKPTQGWIGGTGYPDVVWVPVSEKKD